jgi:flotillin
VPPLNDLFNMAGLNLPTYLKGEDKPKDNPSKPGNEKTSES